MPLADMGFRRACSAKPSGLLEMRSYPLLSDHRTSGKRSITMFPSNMYLMAACSAPYVLGAVFMATMLFNAMTFIDVV